jgi:hypothetical protein
VGAVPATDGITSGADLWHTVSGLTFTSFSENPIPADFFCPGSKPFSGAISMKGEPLSTAPAGALGNVDTIVRRLAFAPFDRNGEATTPIQLLALSLSGEKVFDAGCARYHVTASLAGEQPKTEMKIVRTSPEGGFYVAPLELNVKLIFTPVDGKGAVRELTNQVSLGPGTSSVWSYSKGQAQVAVKRSGEIKVDTDGDRVPDAMVPAPDDFVAGFDPAAIKADALCKGESCHCAKWSRDPYVPNWYCLHLHCVEVWYDCKHPIPEKRDGPIPVEPGSDETGPVRSEERRVGKECRRLCRSRWSPYH